MEHDPISLAQLQLNNQFQSLGCSIDDYTIEVAEPEGCATAVKEPGKLKAVKRQLRSCDEEWLREFEECGGIEALWSSLEASTKSQQIDVMLQYTECIKALFSKVDMVDVIIKADAGKYVKRLMLALDLPATPEYALVKIHILLLLSVITKRSDKGYRATINAFDNYKREKLFRHRFSLLIHELSCESSPPEYQAVVLAFINYLFSSCDGLDGRVKLRSSLNALDLPEVIKVVCDIPGIPNILLQQVRIYQERQSRDEEQLDMPGGVNITDHEHIFRVLYEKFFNTEHSDTLLSILQKMFLIERDAPTTEAIFKSLDDFLKSALIITDPSQANLIGQSSIKKLKDALEKEDLRKQADTPIAFDSTMPDSAANDTTDGIAEGNSATADNEVVTDDQAPPQTAQPSSSPVPPASDSSQPSGTSPLPPEGSIVPPPPSAGPPTPPRPPPEPYPLPESSEESDSKWIMTQAVMTLFQKARSIRTRRKLKRLNLGKVEKQVASRKSAIWHEAVDGDVKLPFDVEAIRDAVEKFFHNEFKSKKLQEKKKDTPKQKSLGMVSCCSINVMLNDLKSVTQQEIVNIIKTSKDDGPLLLHHINAIDTVIKQQEEIAPFIDFEGDVSLLGPAERFIVELSKLEMFQFRVKILKSIMTFDETVNCILDLFKVMNKALDELMSSQSLKEIMFIILLMENVINSSTKQGPAYGFTISSLQQLTGLAANVSRKGTNFLHYLISILQAERPTLLSFTDELPTLRDAERIPYGDLEKQIETLKEEIEEHKSEMKKTRKVPEDVAAKANVFLPNADSRLAHVVEIQKSVVKKSKEAAEYFCDERQNAVFIVKVFKEMLQFVDEFQEATQVVKIYEPFPSVWVKKQEEKEKEVEPMPLDKTSQTKEAIAAITEEELTIDEEAIKSSLPTVANPFEAAFKNEQKQLSSLSSITSPMSSITSQYFTPLSSLATIPSMNEEEEQPMTLASASMAEKRHQRPVPNRQISHMAQKQYKSHLPVPPSYHRSHSVADRPSNIFGSNLTDVQRILHNMSEAIKKDMIN